jgi:CRISPR-associated protein Cas5d
VLHTTGDEVLEAIYWKPEVTWRIGEIWVLRPIRYASFRRNEVTTRASSRTALEWAAHGGGYFVDEVDDKGSPKHRAQRHTVALRDVAYVIRAWPEPVSGLEADAAKARDQFRCFATPYLGCREFAAAFAVPTPADRPIERTEPLGRMLLSIDYSLDGAGHGRPRFFEAQLDGGVLRVPAGEGAR